MNKLQAILQWTSGKKTYIGAILAGILGILWSEGYVSDDQAKLVGLLITGFTGVAIRQAIAKTRGEVARDVMGMLFSMMEGAAQVQRQDQQNAALPGDALLNRNDVNSTVQQLKGELRDHA